MASHEAYNGVQGMGGCLGKGGSLFSQIPFKWDAEIMTLSITHHKNWIFIHLTFFLTFIFWCWFL